MDAWVDRLVARAAERLTALGLRSPSVGLLAEARARAAEEVRDRYRARAAALAARMDAGDPSAAERYGALVEAALAAMRQRASELARGRGPIAGLAAAVHERFGRTDETEHLDDPDLDPEVRVAVLAHLDALNTLLGSYRAFFDALAPLMRDDRPTRVLDVAAGHGGFALEAARLAREAGVPLEITASDLRPEYLDLGRVVAEREGLPVRFAVQDALDLSNLRPGANDIVLCTQSLHHFDPGMVARLFREASRHAARGVVFIDGSRSFLNGLVVPTLGRLRYRDPAFVHDTWVSFRRFYAPEELGLIARLGPEAADVEAGWMAPGHCLLRWRRRVSDDEK
ncbi:MAG TPA: methyltransferase domain-containing protein [Sandaracinaceae bacterium LLY-WYZ-13_1]|nr:methyltransferase domain-containing protein [Sandaracinaceae bacterium LLY-WYZ-13_1]